MKLKVLGAIIICVGVCFTLTGCGNNENANTSESSNIEQQVVTNTTSKNNATEQQADSDISDSEKKMRKIADTWMSMPKNIDLNWKMEVKNANEYSTNEEIKRGNNVMSYYIEKLENGKIYTPETDGWSNQYYYYYFIGNYKWKSYGYFSTKGWDSWYFNGNYPASPQAYCFGKPWNILDKYSNEHETIKIEGVGEVDTVKGIDDEGYTYYYSKQLNMNVKIENNVQIWQLTKYDSTVSSSFPHALPDMKAIDAKKAE